MHGESGPFSLTNDTQGNSDPLCMKLLTTLLFTLVFQDFRFADPPPTLTSTVGGGVKRKDENDRRKQTEFLLVHSPYDLLWRFGKGDFRAAILLDESLDVPQTS